VKIGYLARREVVLSSESLKRSIKKTISFLYESNLLDKSIGNQIKYDQIEKIDKFTEKRHAPQQNLQYFFMNKALLTI